MSAYKLTNFGTVIRTEDSLQIPPSMAVGAYREYLDWLAQGNTPDPADPKPRKQRSIASIEADVETWLSTATNTQKAKALAWALTGAALANGQLNALKNLTQIDPTEPDS